MEADKDAAAVTKEDVAAAKSAKTFREGGMFDCSVDVERYEVAAVDEGKQGGSGEAAVLDGAGQDAAGGGAVAVGKDEGSSSDEKSESKEATLDKGNGGEEECLSEGANSQEEPRSNGTGNGTVSSSDTDNDGCKAPPTTPEGTDPCMHPGEDRHLYVISAFTSRSQILVETPFKVCVYRTYGSRTELGALLLQKFGITVRLK